MAKNRENKKKRLRKAREADVTLPTYQVIAASGKEVMQG
jgi:hypothetical protein